MRRRPTARRVVFAVLTPLLCYYLWLTLSRASTLLADRRPAFRGMGVGLVVLVVVSAGLVVAELRFGRQAERLSRAYDQSVSVDGVPLPVTPSGRPDRDAADAAFDRARIAVEERPGEWQGWYRLALAYGDARDVARGRRAMRRAIALHRKAGP